MRIKEEVAVWLFLLMRIASVWSQGYQSHESRAPPDIRGLSFGLENFLAQPFSYEEGAENPNVNLEMKRTRTRGSSWPKKSINNEDNERFTPVFEPVEHSRENPPPRKPARPSRRKSTAPAPVLMEPPVHDLIDIEEFENKFLQEHQNGFNLDSSQEQDESNGIVKRLTLEKMKLAGEALATVRRPLEKPTTFQTTPEPAPVEPTGQEVSSERPRRVVMMKRRRKRPNSPAEVPTTASTTEEVTVKEQFVEPESTTKKEVTNPPVDQNSQTLRRKRPTGFRRLPTPQIEEISPTEVPNEVQDENPFVTFKEKIDHERPSPTEVVTIKPEVQPPKEEEPTRETTQEPSSKRLKTLLKQQPQSLSLSELLQTQNLSLADFLKGNTGAIKALGGKKVEEAKPVPKPVPKSESRRDQLHSTIPSISAKSRPFSKNSIDVEKHAQPSKPPATSSNLIEETNSRPTYNGFFPKNPRFRQPSHQLHEKSSHKNEEEEGTRGSTTYKQGNSRFNEDAGKERSTTERTTTTTRSHDTTVGEPRVVPKTRFENMRSKLRIDRRKFNSTAHESTPETTESTSTSTASTASSSTKSYNRVRIPFTSSNNPELSLILPNKSKNSNNGEQGDRLPSTRDRFQMFKKFNVGRDEPKQEVKTTSEKPTTKEHHKVSTLSPFEFEIPSLKIREEKDESPKNKFMNHLKKKDYEPEEARPTVYEKETEVPYEYKNYETKDEIVELLRSGSSAQRLERILASRNMTIEELLENREEGSSQTTFEMLFKDPRDSEDSNKETTIQHRATTKEPLADDDFGFLSSFANTRPAPRPKISKHLHTSDELNGEESAINEVKISLPIGKDRELNVGKKKIHEQNLSPNHPTSATNIETPSTRQTTDSHNPKHNQIETNADSVEIPKPNFEIPKITKIGDNIYTDSDIILLETIKRSQEANRKLKHNINEILQEQSEVKESHNDIEKSFIPPAVKSAIIASGVVLGIALFVFVAIFAACGWKQRQIRLKARSPILNDVITRSESEKKIKRNNTLSPVSFKRSSMYKKSLDFNETGSSLSGSSNASSYLWNTLKNTLTSRNNTLKNRLERESSVKDQCSASALKKEENWTTSLLREEARLQEERLSTLQRRSERYGVGKTDTERNAMKTCLRLREELKRGGNSSNHHGCGHGN